jgi:hypothetical protein
MELYLFNPDSDLALANNEANYIAPASARRMAQDMALLPIWYAAPGKGVCCELKMRTLPFCETCAERLTEISSAVQKQVRDGVFIIDFSFIVCDVF